MNIFFIVDNGEQSNHPNNGWLWTSKYGMKVINCLVCLCSNELPGTFDVICVTNFYNYDLLYIY